MKTYTCYCAAAPRHHAIRVQAQSPRIAQLKAALLYGLHSSESYRIHPVEEA